MLKKMCSVFVMCAMAMSMTACGPPLTDRYVDIQPHETAFVIPMEGDTGAQGQFMSVDYLTKNKIASKRIYIPLTKIDTGRFYWHYKWEETVKVITVNRTPVTFVWEDERGIKVESRDSIGFRVGIDITARVQEKDTATFLYNYPSGDLRKVLGENVKSKVTEDLSREFAKYDLEGSEAYNGLPGVEGARQKKGEIVDTTKADLIDFFSKKGVTIDVLGLIGGLQYEDAEIQVAINENFKSELDIKDQVNKNLAQEKINKRKIGMADAEKNAALKWAEAAEIRAQMIGLEVDKTLAEAELIKSQKWNGQLPANIMPQGSNFILDMK